jgi:O-antigen/teichoic acid export membrane protein
MVSKAFSFVVQAFGIPIVYRCLGPASFGEYMTLMAAVGVVGVFNLGIGGSIVTPVAAAAAVQDFAEERRLVQAGLIPLLCLAALASLILIPISAFAPLEVLLGNLGKSGPNDLRTALVLAVVSSCFALPLSAVEALRQAYNETHLTNLFGAVTNAATATLIGLAALTANSLIAFVAIASVVPLIGRTLNLIHLFVCRPYLLFGATLPAKDAVVPLIGDGLRYMGWTFSYVLLYQWPIYWLARSKSAIEIANFSISVQVTLVPITFMVGLLQPLWPATANAKESGDIPWIRARLSAGLKAVGVLAFLFVVLSFGFGELAVRLWFGPNLVLSRSVLFLMSIYAALAIWEYLNTMILFGLGSLRTTTSKVFQRSAITALAIALLSPFGGAELIWVLMLSGMAVTTMLALPYRLEKGLRSLE